jgi:hypothetical protein
MFDPQYKSEMRVGLGTIAKSHNKSTRSMSMNDVSGSNELRRSLKW